jgi:hypothetical protein
MNVFKRLFLLLLVGIFGAASAQPVSASEPVRVLHCTVNTPHYNVYQVDPYGRAYAQQGKSTTADIVFVNQGTQVATAIMFGLVVQSVLAAEMKNNGKFSPGVKISQTLGISNAALQVKNARCIALTVKWADGTEWKSPELLTLTHIQH